MDKNRPGAVSIAMTTYNGEKFILEQLGSILAQTRKPDEVIICDDGSTDGTTALVEGFINENHLNNWHLTFNTVNLGYIGNFCNAIGRTTGDIIFLCDQDDVWHQDKIAKMVSIFEEYNHVKVLNSGFQKIDQNGQPICTKQRMNRSNNNLITRRLKPKEVSAFRFDDIIWRNISPGCTLAFSNEVKAFFLKNHTGLCPHDWEINIFGAALDGLYFYNDELMGYRIHDNNTIGLADLKLSDRISGNAPDKRIMLAEQEYKRANAYMNAPWGGQLISSQHKALGRLSRLTKFRYQAISTKRLSLWLKLLLHPRDYLRLRGLQGIYNDFKAIKTMQGK